MATRNLSPRADGEGSIGTTLKKWLKGWFGSIFVSGNLTDGTNNATVAEIRNQIDNPSVPDADEIATDDSGETVQDKIDDADAHIADTANPHSVDKADVGLTDVPDLDTTDAVNHVSDTENPHSVEADQVATDDSGETVQDKIDDADAHIADTANPHSVDKADVGLTDVPDLDTTDAVNHVSDTENPHSVEADQVATDDSGETVQDKIDDADAHIADTANPHSVDKADVGLTDVPDLDTTDAVNHVSDTENPHSVEADQVATDDSGETVQDKIDDADAHIADTANPHSVDKADVGLTDVPDLDTTDAVNHVSDTENPHSVEADQVATDDSGETVQDKIDDADAHIADTANPHSVDKADVGLTDVPDLDTTDAVNHVSDTENPHSVEADQVATDDSGETVQDKIDDADAHIADTANPHSVDKADVSLSDVDDVQQMPLSYLDTDDALGADSDVKVPSQSAVKSYIDALLSANDAMTYKGVIDCSGNPNYPAGDAGDTYRISVAGKIGGASGASVEVGDIAICVADSIASGDHATVGAYWNIIQVNIDGNVVAVSPFTSTDDNIPKYSGTSGRILEDSGVAISTVSNHIANTNNPHSVEADQVATDDSGETVQDKIDDADAHIADTANPHSVDKADVGLTDVPDLDTTDAVNHVSDTENPHSVEADQVATDDSGVNVQDALDSVESDVVDLKKSSVTFIIDGGGAEITTGIKGDILIPSGFNGTITEATLLADQSGSIIIDIWNDVYGNFAPDNDDSITASAPPTITTATKSQDSTLTGWTKAISAGDILRFNVDSVTDIERVTLTLDITRT